MYPPGAFLSGVRRLFDDDLGASLIPSIRFIYRKKREPTSGLEPLTWSLLTSDASGVAGVCTGLQIPHI
jgi:hypothetical protein